MSGGYVIKEIGESENCPACGASAMAFRPYFMAFSPVMAVCYGDRPHSWVIAHESHAWRKWEASKKEVRNGEVLWVNKNT